MTVLRGLTRETNGYTARLDERRKVMNNANKKKEE
jgi:hypothetical protein